MAGAKILMDTAIELLTIKNSLIKSIEELYTLVVSITEENKSLIDKEEKIKRDNYCLRMQLENAGIKIIEENEK
jgi:hypothetical protein